MDNQKVFDCPYPFGSYLKELTNNIIVLFDEELNVLDCNDRFVELSRFGRGEIKGRQLEELLIAEQSDLSKLPAEGSYTKLSVQLSDLFSPGSEYFFSSYLFNASGFYCLIGEEKRGGGKDVLEEISLLNNALSNKTRQLTKKNKKLEEANRRIEELSRTDHLTGLANRRHFMEYFEKLLSSAQRRGDPLSLAMIDLDDFKSINDTYGHGVGDDVLAALGDLLCEQARKEDQPARIGGEEFAVLITQADLGRARSYAERIRQKIAELEVGSCPQDFTASIGICVSQNGDDPESMLRRADEALYRAKRDGKNKVCEPS